jgi:cytochrome c-type biogenesis protein CcmF
VFLGTFSPVFIEILRGDKISVGPPYYARTFAPLAVPLLLLSVIGPVLNWKRDDWRAVARRVRIPAALALAVALLAIVTGSWQHLLTAAALALAAWLIAGGVAVLARRWHAGRANVWRSVRTTPKAVFGLALAHAGLGLLTLGVTGVTSWESDKVLTMQPGQSVAFAGRTLTLDALETRQGPNYEAREARFMVQGLGSPYLLISERRFYGSSQTQTTEAGIHVTPLGNLYLSVGDEGAQGVVVRLWNHPLIVWIWLGGFTMALGGLVSLSDRKVRVGAPRRALAPAPVPVAAE